MRLYYLDVTEIPCHIILLLSIGKLKLMEISCNASQKGFGNSFWIFSSYGHVCVDLMT